VYGQALDFAPLVTNNNKKRTDSAMVASLAEVQQRIV
jgi:hypothetical protein